ncbi:MarR family winged helix-turn-helix transcriptional regulator [Azospirillum sp. A39]|uniref:MarR family winged helix-turn-helix transcriptional regulator n=1 Tax=Azospirillum sp. A39 TaxID=3462279 RepID=UPI004045F850
MPSTRSVSGLSTHLGYWLRYVSNHVSHAFARKVEEHGVTVAEWVLLRHLFEEEALAPSRLAERMGMTRGAVSKLADRLIAKSLVVRAADPGDGRAQTLSLTAAGRAVVPELAALADANDAAFFGHLAPEDRRALLRILREIVETRRLTSIPVD